MLYLSYKYTVLNAARTQHSCWLQTERINMQGQYQCYCLEKYVLNHAALSTGGYTVTARVMSLIIIIKKENTVLSQHNYAHVLLSSDTALKITRLVMYVQHNIGARSCNHGCQEKPMSINIILSQLHDMYIVHFLCCIIMSSLVCLTLPHFSTLSHKQHDFWKKIMEHKISVLIFSTIFV